MMKLMVDTTANLDENYVAENDIEVIPLFLHMDGKQEPEGPPSQFTSFYERLVSGDSFPKTSQPSIQTMTAAFEKALKAGQEVMMICISSAVSGTYQTACMAAAAVDAARIHIIDSRLGTSTIRFLCDNAFTRQLQGFSPKQMVQEALADIKHMGIHIALDTLEYLHRGGRLSRTAAALGGLLGVKPLLSVVDGKVTLSGGARSHKKAIQAIIGRLPDNCRRIAVIHVLAWESAQACYEQLTKKFPQIQILLEQVSPVMGSHFGPGAIAVCFETER